MARADRSRSMRRGMTLIELLVVITIMMVVAAVAIPALRQPLEGRRLREAARGVNIFLGSARNHALETGRPIGVLLERNGNVCTLLRQIEMPPPYGGDVDPTLVSVSWPGRTGPILARVVQGSVDPAYCRTGDLLQINYQGHWFEVMAFDASSNTIRLTPRLDALPWNDLPSPGLPFIVQRVPSSGSELVSSGAAPLQLPRDAIVDLYASGTEGEPQRFASTATGSDTSPVMVVFSPNGMVARSHWTVVSSGTPVFMTDRANSPLFFLIGRRERPTVPTTLPTATPPDQLPNWIDPASLWVFVNHQTGAVGTVENNFVDPNPPVPPPPMASWTDPAVPQLILSARKFAREASSMGGR